MADETPAPPPIPPRRKAATGSRNTRVRKTGPGINSRATSSGAEAAAGSAAASTSARKPRVAKADSASSSSPKSPRATKPRTAKPRAGKSQTGSVRRSVAQSAPVKLVSDTRDRMGDRNFLAAVLGGVAALGAAAGGILYALRNGSARPTPDSGAHQADGTDSTRSFEAGIADEGTIPE